ncbi:MAG: pyridoxamine 5'-phosphate oxidase family protein [Sulfurimonadaceae bacterium]|jgi:uncharacterized protein YhbP (UPF0306 family)|nr:pyridoxamine 5'-phosphate oxidase family protein [Sulfurimonadaceae bacterium]
MSDSLSKIEKFLTAHHVLTLATCHKDEISACSLFYAYDKEKQRFIVASSEDTTHVKHILQNPKVAGNIPLETKIIANIQGVQFRGVFRLLANEDNHLYYKRFPPALVMQPTLWEIEVEFFKMTDNTLGFGKKIIWER